MKKTKTRRAKRALSLLLSTVLLLSGLAIAPQRAEAENVAAPKADRKLYIWHKVMGEADMPTDYNWHPVILGFLSSDNKQYYLDSRASGEAFATLRWTETYVYNGKTNSIDVEQENAIWATPWPGSAGSNGYYPDLFDTGNRTFYSLDDPLTDIGVLSTGRSLNDEDQYDTTFYISRGMNFADTMWAANVYEKQYNGRYAYYLQTFLNNGAAYEGAAYLADIYASSDARTEARDKNALRTTQMLAVRDQDVRFFDPNKKFPNPPGSGKDGDQINIHDENGWHKTHGAAWSITPGDIKETDSYEKSDYSNAAPGKVRVAYVVDGNDDTFWIHCEDLNGRNLVISDCDGDGGYDYANGEFYMWWAEVKNLPTMIADYTITSGNMMNVHTDMMINEGVTLTVEPNGVLTVDAALHNNGTIINYGTVVVQSGGSINRFLPKIEGRFSEDCGAIYCRGGTFETDTGQTMAAEGNFLILGGARVFMAEGANLLRIESGAMLDVGGLLVCPDAFRLESSDLVIRRSGAVLCHYGTDRKNVLARDYTAVVFRGFGIVMMTPELKKMTNSYSPAIYTSGFYQILNDGVFLSNGAPIREFGAYDYTDLTEMKGSGWTETMNPIAAGSTGWTEQVGTNGITKIEHMTDGTYAVYYDDGSVITHFTDGTGLEDCTTGNVRTHIRYDGSGWYFNDPKAQGSSFASDRSSAEKLGAWSYTRTYISEEAAAKGKDADLVCEGHYDKESDTFISYYYRDDIALAGEALIALRDGTYRIHSFTGGPGTEVLGEQIGTIIKTVNAIGEKSSIANVDYTVKRKVGSDTKNISVKHQLRVYETRSEEWLVFDSEGADAKTELPFCTEYKDGKFAGRKVTYTTLEDDRETLGDYYYLIAEPDVLTEKQKSVTLWRLEDEMNIYVCRARWSPSSKTFDYVVGYRGKSTYDPAKDDAYDANNQWLATKSYANVPNPEIFLKGWPEA